MTVIEHISLFSSFWIFYFKLNEAFHQYKLKKLFFLYLTSIRVDKTKHLYCLQVCGKIENVSITLGNQGWGRGKRLFFHLSRIPVK